MIDWSKPIELDTVPPRPARVVEWDEGSDYPFRVDSDWDGCGDTFRQWVNSDGVRCLELRGHITGGPRVRNVAADPVRDAAHDLLAAAEKLMRAIDVAAADVSFDGEDELRAVIAKAKGL